VKHLNQQELLQRLAEAEQAYAALEVKYQKSCQALEASRQLLKVKDEGMQSLQDFLEEVFYRAKMDGELLELSPSIYKVSGYHAEELIGRNVLDYYASKSQREDYLAALERTGSVRNFPIELVAKDGHIINFSMNSRVVFQDGQAAYIEGAMTDQTAHFQLLDQLREARDEALVASNAKSDFLAIMSHELRTPIHGLMGALTLLRDEALSETQREYVAYAEQSVQTLSHQVNNILDLSKVEAGMMTLHFERFDLLSCVRDVVSILAFEAAEKNLSFHVTWKNSPRFIHGDAMRLRQILLNLLGNAIKFTECGFVRLCISYTPESPNILNFDVEDSGIGLSESEQQSVFDAFTQVDTSTTRHHAGTGLGTTIAQRLIHLMGGEIRVISEAGEGSSFHFFIDIQNKGETLNTAEMLSDVWDVYQLKDECSESEKDEYVPPAQIIKQRVLLADDDPIGLKIVSKALKRHGFDVVSVKDGNEALTMARQHRFNLIILDMQMPYLDGASVTEKIRAMEKQSRSEPTSIIGLSAHALETVRQRCEDVGMNDFLIKPIQMDEVLQILKAGQLLSR